MFRSTMQFNSLRRIIALGLLTGFVPLFLTSSLQAACGDWLEQSASDSDEEANRTHKTPTHSPISCRGPQCQKSPEAPLREAPKRTLPSLDDDRFLRACSDGLSRTSLSHAIEEGTWNLPKGLRSRVERPPRA
jgi:hypothetical protein